MNQITLLCPGQGAQAVGMGKAWHDASPEAAAVFAEADAILGTRLGVKLSELCFSGPADRLNRTDVSQPAIFVCSVACWHGLKARQADLAPGRAAGLSLGEYTALHLAGVFDFATGLELVTTRGRLMQDAAEKSRGGMAALIGADEATAQAICDEAATGEVLVCANFNAPGQIVVSGSAGACERVHGIAQKHGVRSAPLTVAGAFHSPLMAPAAEGMKKALSGVSFELPRLEVWSNVTGDPHVAEKNSELLRQRLVEQLTQPVRWAQSCQKMIAHGPAGYHELAPGTVLKGLMRRIDRAVEVINHDQP